MRGTTSFLSESAFIATIVIGMGMGMDIVLGKSLLLLIGIGLPISIISILIMIPLEDSPKFLLINKKDRNAALRALNFYHGEEIIL